ncbi:MAG: hypothetical protein RLZZ210_535 [Pseudomonadota bacterium]|jgi:rRNA maturation endonuclease Nob1
MRCKNCQLEIDLSDKFCRSCGVLTIKEEDIK